MEFAHKVQLDCYEKVAGYLRELFGEQVRVRNDQPLLGLSIGSAFVETAVWAWGDDSAVVAVRAWVVREAEIAPELLHYLLRKNDEMRFGAFGLDEKNNIFFEHALVGPTCDKVELRASVLAVGHTADQYDDEIIARWGGHRAFE